jgi:hypothetical protein
MRPWPQQAAHGAQAAEGADVPMPTMRAMASGRRPADALVQGDRLATRLGAQPPPQRVGAVGELA